MIKISYGCGCSYTVENLDIVQSTPFHFCSVHGMQTLVVAESVDWLPESEKPPADIVELERMWNL